MVASLTAAIRRYQREIDALDQALAERLGLNRTDLRCVDVLLDRPLSMTELADQAGLSQSAMTTALDRLENAGYACPDQHHGKKEPWLARAFGFFRLARRREHMYVLCHGPTKSTFVVVL